MADINDWLVNTVAPLPPWAVDASDIKNIPGFLSSFVSFFEEEHFCKLEFI